MKVNNMASRRSFLETMTTAELDKLLQELLQKNNTDDLIRMILSVLEERERDTPAEMNSAVITAMEKFESSINIQPSTQAKVKWPQALKVASIVVVMGLLLFVVPQDVHADSFFEMIARWTSSVFAFFSPVDEPDECTEYTFKTDNPGLQQIHDAVVELGITDPVVPMWMPDGYELVECKINNDIQEKMLFAVLSCDTKAIAFRVSLNSEQNDIDIYKDQADVVTYEYNGVNHYILNNLERCIATWNAGNAVCSVVVDCQEDTLFEILKSIYTTEDN